MSKHRVRHNKTCQNCGHFVEKRFCPGCGQENSDSRHSFHHLFTHFISDFLHYDSSFWKTSKTLFTKPGKASLDYMNGKRKSYVNPFSYYIFASFLTFFIPFVLPYPEDDKDVMNIEIENKAAAKDSLLSQIRNNSITIPIDSTKQVDVKIHDNALDLVESIYEKAKDEERDEKISEFFTHNLPKAIFVYMPIFAFWMWLFHNKKKRFYFDSGIFTLHFFSVLLLSITSLIMIDCLLAWQNYTTLRFFLWIALSIYITFYYFRANRIFYQESRFKSNMKAFILMMIHTLFIFIVLLGYTAYTIYKIYI